MSWLLLPILGATALYAWYKKKQADSAPLLPLGAPAQPVARADQPAQTRSREEFEGLDQRLALSAAALGMTTVGKMIAPPLGLLGLPFLVQLSWPYLREGWRNLFEDHEIKVGVLDAITMTGLILLGYDSLAALQIGVLTLGRKLVLKTRNGSEQSLTDAFGEQPRRVWVMTPNGQELEIPFDALKQGDRVIVRAGERIPADGCVAAGIATIDRRMLTGESQPVESGVGDEVFA